MQRLERLEPVLAKCTRLRKLDLGFNRLSSCTHIDKLGDLRELRLDHNKLTKTPELKGNLQLETLRLEHNQITEVSMRVASCV